MTFSPQSLKAQTDKPSWSVVRVPSGSREKPQDAVLKNAAGSGLLLSPLPASTGPPHWENREEALEHHLWWLLRGRNQGVVKE